MGNCGINAKQSVWQHKHNVFLTVSATDIQNEYRKKRQALRLHLMLYKYGEGLKCETGT
jgi:hypothetical protein